MEICQEFTPHPQAIQDVDEFVSSLKQVWINQALLLAHQWILCCEWVPSEWESRELIKTSLQEVIQTTPVHQLTYSEAKSWKFVSNNYTIMVF